MVQSGQAFVNKPASLETDASPTYSVSTWDHERGGWDIRHSAVTKWQIRRCLRELYSEGWDTVSILVERDE
jgi:hypothetical protein